PLLDGVVVAFGRPASGPLPGPAQPLTQDPPHMTGVIGHPRHRLDHRRDPGERPQLGGKPVGRRTLQQCLLHPGQLVGVQTGQPPGPTRRPQRHLAARRPPPIPLRRRLNRHPQLSSHLGRSASPPKQLRCPPAPLLQSLEVPPGAHPVSGLRDGRCSLLLPDITSRGTSHTSIVPPTVSDSGYFARLFSCLSSASRPRNAPSTAEIV